MTPTSVNSAPRFAHIYGNPVMDCDGAQLRAQSRQLATVVTISGRIDDNNIDRIRRYAKRFILAEKPIVLDLSGVTFFSASGMSLLHTVDETCCTVGVEWRLVTGETVNSVLRAFGGQSVFASTNSTPEALNDFLDVALERRRLLPLLNKSA